MVELLILSVLIFLGGFACGYVLRALISRQRHRRWQQEHTLL